MFVPIAMRQRNHLKRNLDPFTNIPPEIITQILSKLPVQTIISCKCVCKSWLTLLDSHEFVKYHLLKSTPGLAVYEFISNLYNFFDFEDGLDLENHELHYKPVTKFNIPDCKGRISGSANGLLFLCNMNNLPKYHALHICNPITCDYIRLDCNPFVHSGGLDVVTYGFGSSKITAQHKVVRIFQEYVSAPGEPPMFVLGGPPTPRRGVPNFECVCHVYTIGTGLWRRISPISGLVYHRYNDVAFLNGILHWLVSKFEGPQLWISCFDLESERFSTFSSPLLKTAHSVGPTSLGDYLCFCDNSLPNGIDIWLMEEYGVVESWTKQFSIVDARPLEAQHIRCNDFVYPIKIFKDGDILLSCENELLFYSKKNNTVQKLETFELRYGINAFLYTPSFLSLKNFEMEKVMPF